LVWITGSIAFTVFLVSLWKLRAELGLPGFTPEAIKEVKLAKPSKIAPKSVKPKSSKKPMAAKTSKSKK
jgi:hypothetical protein